METSFSRFEVVFMFVLLLLLVLLLVLFVASLVASVLMLYMGWRVGPVLRKDSIFCFLSIVLGVFLWVVVLSFLFEPMFARADNPIYYVFYTAAAGATPFAAFPGIVLFSGKKTKP